MAVPEKAEELQKQINDLARTLDESIELAEEPEIHSEAVVEALEEANSQVKKASEQLANVVGGR